MLLVILGILLHCEKGGNGICIQDSLLNMAFWLLVACAFALVCSSFLYDLCEKNRVEQSLPPTVALPNPDQSEADVDRTLRWFWLNAAGHTRLTEWLRMESLLEDVAAVEESMVDWFNHIFPGIKLPINHFHLEEKPHPTVQFLDQARN